MIRYIFGTEEEADSFFKAAKGDMTIGRIEVVGAGAEDLKWHSEQDVLVNIGYCCAYKVIPGMIIEPSYVMNAKTREIIRITPVFPVENRICITSLEPVKDPIVDYASIYDMELFRIASSHFGVVHSLKIVNGSIEDGETKNINKEEQWAKVVELVRQCLKNENGR